MGLDAAIGSASAPRDLARKKKTNRSARLKQCKLDARREQWLSQGRKKGCKPTEDLMDQSPLCPTRRPCTSNLMNVVDMETRNDKSGVVNGKDQRLSIDVPVISSWENLLETDCPKNNLGNLTSSSGTHSGSISDADDYDEDDGQSGGGEEGGGPDDWEAVADALTTNGSSLMHQQKEVYWPLHPKEDTDIASVDAPPVIEKQCDPSCGISRAPQQTRSVSRAWEPNDAFRPRSLPNLSKPHCISTSMLQSCNAEAAVWGACSNSDFLPLSCPICFEDLDLTDTSFIPCSCGFHLCLFCHKRILESDGRCPGCRKQYSSTNGSSVPVGKGTFAMENCLSQSRSMSARP